jgi:hypothetical protein
MAKAGTAYVEIHGDFDPLIRELAILSQGKLGQAITAAGQSLSRDLSVPMTDASGSAKTLTGNIDQVAKSSNAAAVATQHWGDRERAKSAASRSDLAQWGIAATTAKTKAAALSTVVDGLAAETKDPLVIKVVFDTSALSATARQISAAQVAGASGAGGGGGAGFLGGLLGGAGAGGGGGGGGPRSVLWGHGAGGGRSPRWMGLLLGGGALAGAGTVGSFAGFGAEHALFTLGGIAGSAGAAAAGGGVIAAGALGQMAVGGGSDLAVMKSTIADTKTLGTAYEGVTQAVALYGAKSKQAAVANAQLSLTMQELGNTAGVKAEMGLAKSAQSLNKLWDLKTGRARVQAVNIAEQGIGLGKTYVPMIAHAAQANLSIINQSLKPLFSWLKGPEGMGVFQTLEHNFKATLPTAMHAFQEGVEFVAKTMKVASQYTGGFVEGIDHLLTKANSPEGFAKWEVMMGHLVGDFHLWATFIKELVRDIFDLFSQDAQTGNGIIATLTGMLAKLGEWERSVAGKSQLHNIFTVHKEEIIELLKILPPLLKGFGSIYLTIAPPLVKAVTGIAKAIAWLLEELDSLGPAIRDLLGLGLVALKLGKLKAVLGLLGISFGKTVVGSEAVVASNEALIASNEALATSFAGVGAAASDAVAVQGAAAVAGAGTVGAGVAAGDIGVGAAAGGAGAATDIGAGLSVGALTAGKGAALASRLTGGLASTLGGALAAATAGYFAAEIGAHILEKITGSHFLEGQGIAQQLFDGFNTEGVKQTEENALNNAKAHVKANEQLEATLARSRHALLAGSSPAGALSLSRIETLATAGREASADIFGSRKEKSGRSASLMEGAIKDIENGVKKGTIKAKEGRDEINHLLNEIHIIRGNDPFGLAKASAASFEKAGHITHEGVTQWINELDRMPTGAREKTSETTLAILHKWAAGKPAIEKEVDALSGHIISRFGLTKTQTSSAVSKMVQNVEHGMTSLGGAVGTALEGMGIGVGAFLKEMGIGGFKTQMKHLKPSGVKGSELGFHATGGHVTTPGYFAGEEAPAHPEWIIATNPAYRNNNIAYWAQAGHDLGVPGFAKGGLHEPQLEGPAGWGRTGGQGGIHKGFLAAQIFEKAHKPKHSGSAAISLANLGGTRFQIAAAEAHRAHAPHKAILALFEALIDEGGPFNNVLEGEGAGTGAPIMSAAREIAGFLTGRPVWTGNGSAIALSANPKLKAYEIAQIIQASGAGQSSMGRANYGSHQAEAEAIMKQYGFAKGGRMGGTQRLAGLIQREEERGGVPQTAKTKTKAEKATPTMAVQWAMRHLGSTYDYGLPEAWCGAFLGDDMKSIGLAPPSGFPAAVAWSHYGTPLGRGHIQAGAILDYNEQHVAMAISASEMISGDWSNRVATSPIKHDVAGTPLSAVRWPPYGSGPGAGSAAPKPSVPKQLTGTYGAAKGSTGEGGGTNAPPMKYKVVTSSLSFGSLPTKIHPCRKELAELRAKLPEYQAALHDTKDPATKRALEGNIRAIRHRIGALITQIGRILAAEKHARLVKKIEGSDVMPAVEAAIANAERSYDEASEYAEQIVGLEPEEPPKYVGDFGKSVIQPYIEGHEAPAWADVLQREADWRNTILGGESAAAMRLAALQAHVERIEALKETDPTAYNKQKFRLPPLHKAIEGVQALYTPPLAVATGEGASYVSALANLAAGRYTGGTGSFEEALTNVQGIGHSRLNIPALPSAPVAGTFGGLIWDTQMQIKELGLKIQQAGESGMSDESAAASERTAALEELLRQANQRSLVETGLGSVLKQFETTYPMVMEMPPYAGKAHTGAIVPGPRTQEKTMVVKGGEGIFTQEQMAAMGTGSGDVHVVVNGHINQEPGDTRDPIEVLKRDPRFGRMVREEIRTTQRGVVTSGAGRAFRP